MNIREQAIETIKNPDTKKIGGSIIQKVKLFAWETGLAPVMNALPDTFGQQAVLYFPARSKKYSYPCCEHNGIILLALTEKELSAIRENLLQNPGVEVWLKNGWFAGTARQLTAEEQNEVAASLSDGQFFGNASQKLGSRSLKDHVLLEVTRSAPCTGAGGPASKAWIWPIAAIILLFNRKK